MNEAIQSKQVFHKVCVYRSCSKSFESLSRNTRFCCPECQQKHQAQSKRRRKDYAENRVAALVKVQAHKLCRLVLEMEVLEGRRSPGCEFKEDYFQEAPACGCKEWEGHHKNKDFLDNRPENLKMLCKVHHAKEHSIMAAQEKTAALMEQLT